MTDIAVEKHNPCRYHTVPILTWARLAPVYDLLKLQDLSIVPWLAPECIISVDEHTAASDVWSYGVLLYELTACGRWRHHTFRRHLLSSCITFLSPAVISRSFCYRVFNSSLSFSHRLMTLACTTCTWVLMTLIMCSLPRKRSVRWHWAGWRWFLRLGREHIDNDWKQWTPVRYM